MTRNDIDAALSTILRLAHALSTQFTGAPEMYDANKILHAAWRIQGAVARQKIQDATPPDVGQAR